MLITHSPRSVSIKREDANPISAKATPAHGVMFALALFPAWRKLARFSWSRTALTDYIHPDTKSVATTLLMQHMSVTLALETNSQLRSYCCGSDACSICTIDGSWSHLTPQTHSYSKNLLWVSFTSSLQGLQWWLPLKSSKSSIQLLFSEKHNWTQKLSEYTHLPGLQLQTLWTTHPLKPGAKNHTRSPLLGAGLQKLWNPPFLIDLPSTPAESGDPLPAQAQRKKHGIVWSWCFKCKGAEIFSVCHTPTKSLTSDSSRPKWVQASPFFSPFFILLLFTGPHS